MNPKDIEENSFTGMKLYRPNVGLALFGPDGRVFVGERIDTPGAWQMPQGGMQSGEDVWEAALREMVEEIGTDKAALLRVADRLIRYDVPPALAQDIWQGKYCGQEQRWVAARFTGEDQDIDLAAFEIPEFSAWQWVTLEDTVDLVVPFKRDVYRQVIALFSDIPALL
ncbi:MAG: RNA pyrophosphohydrolase [Alphaproteobacteria bacterium]|nr:RNA pyrophosphohydrolase [Alphaproteobacteria bacterium]